MNELNEISQVDKVNKPCEKVNKDEKNKLIKNDRKWFPELKNVSLSLSLISNIYSLRKITIKWTVVEILSDSLKKCHVGFTLVPSKALFDKKLKICPFYLFRNSLFLIMCVYLLQEQWEEIIGIKYFLI